MNEHEKINQKAAPGTPERLFVKDPEDYDGIDTKPSILPKSGDKERWERWYDSLITAFLAAGTLAIIIGIGTIFF